MPAYRSVTIRDHSSPVHRVYLTAPWKRSWRTLEASEATGLDYAEVRSAQALGLLILRAQRRDLAAQCTCGGLLHHRATCPAVALCAGCVHEG